MTRVYLAVRIHGKQSRTQQLAEFVDWQALNVLGTFALGFVYFQDFVRDKLEPDFKLFCHIKIWYGIDVWHSECPFLFFIFVYIDLFRFISRNIRFQARLSGLCQRRALQRMGRGDYEMSLL